MAVPTFVAASNMAGVSGGNASVALPSGWQADDIAVLQVMTNAGNTFPTPAGWAVLGTAVNSANQSTAWFWKRLVGGETTPIVFTIASGTALSASNGLYARTFAFRGCVASGNPFEDVVNTGSPTTNTTPQTGATFTTDGPNRLVVCLVAVDDDNNWSSGNPPANWTVTGTRTTDTVGGDCMMDAIRQAVPQTGTSITQANIGTMNAADYWRTLTFALAPKVEAASTLTDDFNDDSIDTTKWNEVEIVSGVATETGTQVSCALAASANTQAGLISLEQFNLVSSSIAVSVTDYGAASATKQLYLRAKIDVNNSIMVNWLGTGSLRAYQQISSSLTAIASTTITPTDFRLRESSGTTYWEYSTDNQDSWNILHSVANPIPVVAVYLEFGAYDSVGVAATIKFDNFNTTPIVFNDTPSGTTTASGSITEAFGTIFNDSPSGTAPPSGSITESLTTPRRARIYWAELIISVSTGDITESGTVTSTGTHDGLDVLVDVAVQTTVSSQPAPLEAKVDVAVQTTVSSHSALDAITEAGTQTTIFIQSALETETDVGVQTTISTQSALETKIDVGVQTTISSQPAPLEHLVDVGIQTTISTHLAPLDVLAEAALQTTISSQSGADEIFTDIGENTIVVSHGASTYVAEHIEMGVNTVVVDVSGTTGDAIDAGVNLVVIIHSAIEAIADAPEVTTSVVVFGFIPVVDTFTDTDDTLLSAHQSDSGHRWLIHPVTVESGQITTNRVRPKTSTQFAYIANAALQKDVVIEATIRHIGGTGTKRMGVLARVHPTLQTWYLARYDTALGQWEIFHTLSGTSTTIGTYVTSFASGTEVEIRFEVSDAAKVLYIDGVERIRTTDNTITAAGGVGLRGQQPTDSNINGIRLDNFRLYVYQDVLVDVGVQTSISNHDASTYAAADIQETGINTVVAVHSGLDTTGDAALHIVAINHAASSLTNPSFFTLIDNFNDDSMSVAWTVEGIGDAAEINQHIELDRTDGSVAVVTTRGYTLIASSAFVHLISAGGTAPAEFRLRTSDQAHSLSFVIADGEIEAWMDGAMIETGIYVPSVHGWLRIREDDGIIYWDTSVESASWTNFASANSEFPVDDLRAVLYAGSA
jgi:hypothetical protein